MRKAILLLGLALTVQCSDDRVGENDEPLTISFNAFIGGVWHADDGSLYYIRQIGSEIWWMGTSVDSTFGYLDFFKGVRFTNLFHGFVSGSTVSGSWVDVPRGGNLGSGTLTLNVSGGTMTKVSQTGGFGPSTWSNSSVSLPLTACSLTPGVHCEFMNVYKNDQSSTLLDNLKPEKDYVAVFGNVRGGLRVSFHADYWPPTYDNFLAMYAADGGADADLDFEITVDMNWLNAIPGFWTDGWLYSDGPSVVQSKFNATGNEIGAESIMFGRTNATTPPLLPGWAEAPANSPLWNGVPINGSVQGPEAGPNTVRYQGLNVGQRVRVSGVLALDCGHGWTSDCEDPSSPAEIHPVYAVDVVQDWTVPRLPSTNLTGTWAGSDMSTLYVRQIGSQVWWLHLSRDQGQTYAKVFLGTTGTEYLNGVSRQVVTGTWVDVPVGQASGSGTLKLDGAMFINNSYDIYQPIGWDNNLSVYYSSTGYPITRMDKLYDQGVSSSGSL